MEDLWLGLKLRRYQPSFPKAFANRIMDMRAASVSRNGYSYTPVYAVGEDKDGNIWIGLVERGLMKWNQKGEKTCARSLFSPNDITSISNPHYYPDC